MAYRVRSKFRLVAVALVIFLAIGGGVMWATGITPSDIMGTEGDGDPLMRGDLMKGRMNVLLLGVDSRKGESMARADTIMLASVDTEKNQLSLLSIPRDTRLMIPGRGWEKINSATLYGGPSLALRTVSDFLGVPVDKYVVTNYQGFEEIVDALGGVTINVERRMYHYDPQDKGAYTIDLKPGEQRLNGKKALQFVRFRGYALGDISRTEQQQKFLAALVKEVMQPGTVLKLPRLVPKVNGAVETNLALAEMVKLAKTAGTMSGASVVTQTLPGKFLDLNGVSYWSVEPAEAKIAMTRLMNGEKASLVVQGATVSDSRPKDTGTTVEEPVQEVIVPGQPGAKATSSVGDLDDQKASVTTPKSGGAPVAVKPVPDKTGSGSAGSNQVVVPPSPVPGSKTTTGTGTGVEVSITPGGSSTGSAAPVQGGIVPGTVVPPL